MDSTSGIVTEPIPGRHGGPAMTVAVARRVRLPDLTALALLALTAGVALAFHARLPAEAVVGWRLGLDGETTLTHAPRWVATALVPALAVGTFAVARAVVTVPAVSDELGEAGVRWVYDAAVHAALVACCLAEVALVAANL